MIYKLWLDLMLKGIDSIKQKMRLNKFSQNV